MSKFTEKKITPIVSRWMDNNLPTVYAEGLSWYELLHILTTKINDLIEQYNIKIGEINDVLDSLDGKLETLITDILNEWYEKGVMSELVSDTLLKDFVDKDELYKAINEIGNEINNIINMRRYVSITEMGAINDINYDNTLAINAAIEKAHLLNKPVYFPAGIYSISGTNIFKVYNGMEFFGCGKNSIIKIRDNNGDWQSIFYSERNEVIEDITIHDLTFDCNNKNTNLSDSNAWNGDVGRVMCLFPMSKNIKIYNNTFIHNGCWTIRSKAINADIYNNSFYFDNQNITLDEFDISTIWIGGKDNKIHDNRFDSYVRGTWAGRTAIECQGHNIQVYNNVVDNYSMGIIITNSTAYENPMLGVSEKGNKYSQIYNNSFNTQGAVNIWPMNTGDNAGIVGLKIYNNNFTSKIINPKKESRMLFIYRGNASDWDHQANGKQTGYIKDLSIFNNTFYHNDNSAVNPLLIDITPSVMTEHVNIYSNKLYKAKTAIRLGVIDKVDGKEDIPKEYYVKEINITNNTIVDCLTPIHFLGRTKNTCIHGNIFVQDTEHAIGNNSIEIVSNENKNAGKFSYIDNSLYYPDSVTPYQPLPELTEVKTHVVPPYENLQESIFINRYSFVYNVKKNELYKVGSLYGACVGNMTEDITISDYDFSLRRGYIEVSDASNIKINDVFCLNSNVYMNINTLSVYAIEKNRLYLKFTPTLKGGQEIKGQKLFYNDKVLVAI